MIYVIIGVVLWAVCGVFAYGLAFAGLQRAFPTLAERDYKKDKQQALYISCTGPIGIVVELSLDRAKYGLKFK